MGQNLTHASQQAASLFDQLIGSEEQRLRDRHVISREEFIRMDPGEIYDQFICCGAPAVIFRHDNGGHIAVEDSNSVYFEQPASWAA